MRSVLLPILLLCVAKSSSFVDGSGNVGCLFSEELCKTETQWCYDDGAFGRCLPTGPGADEEIYRHNLQQEDLEKLEYELGQLLENGYRWSHRHTQCVLQALLHSFRTGSSFDRIICDRLKEKDLESALNSGDVNDEVDPGSLAYIKYEPNDNDQSPDYARIVYYSTKERNPDDGVYGVEEDVEYDEPYTIVRRSLPASWESDHFSTLYNTPDHFRSGFELKDLPGDRLLREAPETGDEENPKQDEDYYDEDPDFMVPIRDKISSVVPPNFLEGPNIVDDWNEDDEDDELETNDKPLFLLSSSDQQSQFGPMFESPGSGVDEGYTEGGVISIPSAQGYQEMQDMQDSWLESLGFKRRERLDVKKPGPPYDPAFQKKLTTVKPKLNETNKKEGQKEEISNALPMQPMKQMFSPKSRAVKKIIEEEMADNSQYDVIDTTYTYIEFRNDIKTWKEGRAIVDKIAELLKVPKELFTKERVDRNEVTFQVKEPNSYRLNGTEVARKIENIKDDLGRTAGVFITGYGIGNKSKLPSAERLDMRPDHEMYVVTVIVCGVLAALALSAGVLYLTRRHGYKLANMTSGDTESSKLYQDLCRARMSSKSVPSGHSAGDSAPAPAQRIASLSKESDKDCPSSRSSTSSWSDEPALTNMDVTTGKIVLAYMEEHLQNEERLETEWTALCAYEADPCATTIAQRPENLQKNRYPHALPYDHARVVLNELCNITESDYINASTIEHLTPPNISPYPVFEEPVPSSQKIFNLEADHDPRNAAYIVTQGALPHTVPDLWQMVWEQGCVVLVMLSRLGEPDTPLCHRYWPEDGSEIYHIYEVHLVGEYMWCDDYVVRSFYLKNMKTGETRTVTQFHFLSWPDGGVPSATKSLLEFRRKVNKSFRGRSCPIVVHCSDGVGRSGAYVLMDMVLNRIAKGAKEIDIAATLEHIRDQRAGAVATKKQFQFVLQAVADEVQAILKVLQQQ